MMWIRKLLGWVGKARASYRFFAWLKRSCLVAGLSLAILFTGAWAFRSPGVAWQTYSDKILLEALKLSKPVIIDFHADWCPPCIKLDMKTFSHPVFSRAATDFILVKVDLTERGDAAHENLIKQYKIRGVPSVIFLDSTGIERRDLRVEEYLGPKEFQSRMAKVKFNCN